MHTLRWTFTLFTVCGIYLQSTSWTSPLKKLLYNVYAACVLVMLYSFLITQLLDIVFNVENQDEFSENFCITVVVFVTCFKVTVLLTHKEHVKILIHMLQKEPFSATNEEEVEIRSRFDKLIEWNSVAYTGLLESCALWIYVSSFITDFKHRKLIYQAWIPYDYSSATSFLFTCGYQVIASTLCIIASIASDTLYSGILIHIYCQFEILQHRLQNIKRDKHYAAKQCAHHHHHIYKYAEMVNDEFKMIILVQFLISMIVLCFNLYRMILIKMNLKFMGTMFYSLCTLTQIFYYCWYGNEVKLKSLQLPDIIFGSEWTSWNGRSKKILLMVMRRARKPIEFTSIHIVSVNLDSFMTLLKTSYSAFNIMQQSREL